MYSQFLQEMTKKKLHRGNHADMSMKSVQHSNEAMPFFNTVVNLFKQRWDSLAVNLSETGWKYCTGEQDVYRPMCLTETNIARS